MSFIQQIIITSLPESEDKLLTLIHNGQHINTEVVKKDMLDAMLTMALGGVGPELSMKN